MAEAKTLEGASELMAWKVRSAKDGVHIDLNMDFGYVAHSGSMTMEDAMNFALDILSAVIYLRDNG